MTGNQKSILQLPFISGKTVICGIIGDPIGHTVSPGMQNAAFRALNLDCVYVPFLVKREDLAQAFQGVRGLNILGLNVTIPHKVAAIRWLDELDSLAEQIGAVNTVVKRDGLLKGYNTDAAGFLRALQAENIKPECKEVVILGAGGAARAISFIMADRGANLTILNRHLDAARGLADWLVKMYRREVKALDLSERNLSESLSRAEILINTTNVGMSPNIDDSLVPVGLLKPGQVVFDIIYNPVKTRLLSEAEAKGARIIGGLEMLVWQGAAAFEIWTGLKAPVGPMREAVIKALK
jgi:shikimate dehydrogenase